MSVRYRASGRVVNCEGCLIQHRDSSRASAPKLKAARRHLPLLPE